MNIKNYLLITALMFSPLMTQTNDTTDTTEISEPKKWMNLSIDCMKHVPSLAISVLVGTGTGSLLSAAESHLVNTLSQQDKSFILTIAASMTIIVLWGSEILARDITMKTIQQQLRKHKITHNNQLMNGLACAAAWVGYLKYQSGIVI